MENKKKIGRPASKNPRNIQVKEEAEKLEYCANEKKLSKTEVINLGIEEIYKTIKK